MNFSSSFDSANVPVRVQLKRTKGWRMPPNTVKVDRTSAWGNHWIVWREDAQWLVTRNASEHHYAPDKATGLAMAVEWHAAELRARLPKYGSMTELLPLRGKNLACWCALDKPCHADVLLELANGPY